MSLGRYYRKLGLPVAATEEEVRKKYRKLVMQYHPDKNPSAAAAAKFLSITEAYEILTGKRPAPRSAIQRSAGTKKSGAPKPTDAAEAARQHRERVKEAKERFEEQQRKEQLENDRYYYRLTTGRLWRLMKISAIVGTIMAVSMLLDQFLPHHFEKDDITHYSLNRAYGGNGESVGVVQTKRGYRHWVSRMNYNLYGRASSVDIETSWIFHQPIRVVAIGKIEHTYYPIHYTMFANYLGVVLLLLLPITTFLYKRKTIGFTILFHTCYYGVNGIILLIFFTGDRWAHLLTAGFL